MYVVFVKITDYDYGDYGEYGLHWNFFFTLFLVKVNILKVSFQRNYFN